MCEGPEEGSSQRTQRKLLWMEYRREGMTQMRLEKQGPGHTRPHEEFGLYSKRMGSRRDFT